MVNHLGNWRNGELGNFITLKRGFDLPQQKREDGQVPIFSSSGITGTHSTAMVNAPGVITGRYGTIGEVFYAAEDFWPLNTTLFVEDFHGNDAKFIYYFLKTLEWSKFTSASAVPGINRNTVHKETVSLPDIETQRRIASTLSMLDEKIKTNTEINDNLEQQAQAIYHERFETVSPNDLPSDWRIVTLGEVATISNKSFNPLKEPETLLEHYSIPAFDEARFPVFELSTSIKSNKFIIDASCFMISKLNPTTKRVWKPYCLTGNAVCSTEFIVYKAKDQSITDFLYSVIDSGSFSDFMCSHVTGSTGSRQRTTPSDTLSYELILPSEDELAEFQSLVSPMYAQMRINAIENDKLKRLRDSLLPKLMSGEIDVSAVRL
jgi:restriction endonuclease S subunit